MPFAVLIALLAIGLGAALMLVSANSPRVLGPLRTFATLAALAVVLSHLLPEAVEALGGKAVVGFVLALLAPGLLHWLGERHVRHGEPAHESEHNRIELEAGYAGLVLHHVGDGVGIGAYSALPGGALAHLDVIVALIAHTMPLVAVVTLAYRAAFGTRAAALRVGGLALASVAGALLPFAVPLPHLEQASAWIGAVASGLLLHVVTHDLTQDPPRTMLARGADLLAAALGVSVALLGSGHAAHDVASGPDFAERAYALSLKAGLPLFVGLGAAAALKAATARFPAKTFSVRGAFGGAVAGVMRALFPSGSFASEPQANEPRAQQAAGIAYVLAAPALALEVLVLTVVFFGIEFAALRFAAALLLPAAVALAVSAFPSEPANVPAKSEIVESRFDHLAVSLLFGIVAAGLLDAHLGPAALLGSSGAPLELLVVSSLALLGSVPALALVPLTWVLVQKGLSPGAALLGLLLGPVLGLARLHGVAHRLGAFKTALAASWLLALGWVLAFLQNERGSLAPLLDARRILPEAFERVLQVAALLLLSAMLRRIFVLGARTWLAAIRS